MLELFCRSVLVVGDGGSVLVVGHRNHEAGWGRWGSLPRFPIVTLPEPIAHVPAKHAGQSAHRGDEYLCGVLTESDFGVAVKNLDDGADENERSQESEPASENERNVIRPKWTPGHL